jgi:hypothetical protein
MHTHPHPHTYRHIVDAADKARKINLLELQLQETHRLARDTLAT